MNALTAVARWGEPLSSKLILAAIVVAMLFASLPATGVLAAPADNQGLTQGELLEQDWSNKLRHLRAEGIFYNNVRLYPADFDDRDDLARAHYYLEKYGVAFRQASTLMANRPGFDLNGRVINEKLAEQSLYELAMYLHIMRGMRNKTAEQGYTIHLMK